MTFPEFARAALVFIIAGLSALRLCPCSCKNCPVKQPAPNVRPSPKEPTPPLSPWGTEKLAVGGPISPDHHTEITCDLPVSERTKNTGGRDGAGLCVFTSIGHAARWQNEKRLVDFQKQMQKEPGGGYPEKVDRMIAKYGKGTPYLQYEGHDPTILRLALKTGRMPSVTYNGHDPHYGERASIAHMVNLIYLDDHQACVLDNNFIGENDLVWMSAKEFMDRWDDGWAVILLAPPPPPPPKN